MAKYIDADTVVSMPFLDDSYGIEKHTVETDTIENLLDRFTKEGCPEPADVAPVVHAYWIPQKENYEFKEAWMKCSACGYPVSRWTGNTNFCPNCGAKMDKE